MPREIIKSRAVNCWNRKAASLNKFFSAFLSTFLQRVIARMGEKLKRFMGNELLLRHFTRSWQVKGPNWHAITICFRHKSRYATSD